MRANKTELRQMLLADQKRLLCSALLCFALQGGGRALVASHRRGARLALHRANAFHSLGEIARGW